MKHRRPRLLQVGRAPNRTACFVALITGALLVHSGQSFGLPGDDAPKEAGQESGEKQPDEAQKPWYRGVSPDTQAVAYKLFQEGVAQHKELFYDQAIARYQEALTHWQHPDIHFNLSLALLAVGRSVEAHSNLLQAMRFGPQSLAERDYQRALAYRERLEKQLVRVRVECQLEGAQVALDDKPLFTGAGVHEVVLLPGPHRLVAEKAEHATDEQWVQLRPGQVKTIKLAPVSLASVAIVEVSCDEPGANVIRDNQPFMQCPARKSETLAPDTAHTFIITRANRVPQQEILVPRAGERLNLKLATSEPSDVVFKRPMPRWVPWATMGVGLTVGIVGGLLRGQAGETMEHFDEDFEERCPNGCLLEQVPDLARAKESAKLQNDTGMISMAVGGVALLAGLALGVLNQPVPHRRPRIMDQPVVITPTLNAKEVGLAAGIRF